MIKFLTSLLVLFFHFSILGQASANFKASVKIINPNNPTVNSPLGLSRVIESPSDANSGESINMNSGDLITAGYFYENLMSFKIEGQTTPNLRISMPKDELLVSNGHIGMIIKDFESTWFKGEGVEKNQYFINIGASIKMPYGLNSGLYTSIEPMKVIVDYN